MTTEPDQMVLTWVSCEILPHESELRNWLRRAVNDLTEIDDIVHDIYSRLLQLRSVGHITDARAYLFQMARNILIDQVRRRRVVQFEMLQSLDDAPDIDAQPSPERAAMARLELRWVLGLIAKLPDRCKKVFELRRIYGLSQAETAQNLSISEGIVEKETSRGLKLISRMVSEAGVERNANATVRPENQGKQSNVQT